MTRTDVKPAQPDTLLRLIDTAVFLLGIALCFLGWRGGRVGLIIFGHTCIVLGCFLITWGIYLLPYSKPVLAHIFGRPLFWGLFSLFGGICANYHGFCQCIRGWKQKQ